MGRVKAWYQEIIENDARDRDYDYFHHVYQMSILEAQQHRREMTEQEINLLAQDAAQQDKS